MAVTIHKIDRVQTGAIKRALMDLSRALAKLRSSKD